MIDKATESKSLQPGILSSLMAGFDIVANHLYLIILPVLLDIFLWIGPKIKVIGLIMDAVEEFSAIAMLQPDLSDMVEAARIMWLTFGERLNLFVLLRTFPIGVPSLSASLMPVENPIGLAMAIDIESRLGLLGASILLSFTGVILGVIYWSMVVQKVMPNYDNADRGARIYLARFVNVLLILILYAIVMLFVGLPVSWIVSLSLLVFSALGQLLIILITGTVLWALIPLFFTMHGVFIRNYGALKSIGAGVKLVTRNFLSTMMFVATVFLLSQIFDAIWRIPPENSWLFVIGILGHAFTATGILTATFIYYRDGISWLDTIDQERLVYEEQGKQE